MRQAACTTIAGSASRLRRLGDGSWYVERQNFDAQNASSEIPTPSKLSTVRKLLTKVKVTG